MVTLLRCRRLLPPLFRARFLAITLTASFLAYIYLLHSAHSIHVSRLSYSPTCQPVAAESSRAIQILRELQDRLHLAGSENSDFFSPFYIGDFSVWGTLRRLLWHSKIDYAESFAWPARVSARRPPPISQWMSKSNTEAQAVYHDRTKVNGDVAAANGDPINVAERVNVITQASFPWRHVTELRSTAWFRQAREDFKAATRTEYSTSCMVEMLLTMRSSQLSASAAVFNPARVHDQRTWEGHSASKLHAHLSSGARLSFAEEYDLPDSLLEHAVSAARSALVAGRNSRGLVCTCGKVVDARESHATTDAEAEAYTPACVCPGWEAKRGEALIPVLLVDRVFVDPIIRTLKDSSGPWRAFLSDASTAQLVLIRRSLGHLLSSDQGPIVYSDVNSRLAYPSLHDVLGLSRVLKLASILVSPPDSDDQVHREALRQVELLSTLEANLRNPVVDRVLYFTESPEEAGWLRRQIPSQLLAKLHTRSLGMQMMYSDALAAANELFESTWTVVLNADVVIGSQWANSAELPSAIEARAQRRMYMLSRKELWPQQFGAGCCSAAKYNGCHDGFAFVPPVSIDLISRARFHQNHWGAENRLAFEMSQTPDALIPGNPCMALPLFHNHASHLRQHQHGSGGLCLWGCIDGREFLNNDGRNVYCMPQMSWDKGCVDHTKLKALQ